MSDSPWLERIARAIYSEFWPKQDDPEVQALFVFDHAAPSARERMLAMARAVLAEIERAISIELQSAATNHPGDQDAAIDESLARVLALFQDAAPKVTS